MRVWRVRGLGRDWVFDYLHGLVVRGNRCEEIDLLFLAREAPIHEYRCILSAVG